MDSNSSRGAEARADGHAGNARIHGAPQKAVAAILFAGSLFAAEPAKAPRIVSASENFNVNCALYYSTIVELPKGEEITAVSTGDQKLWAVHYDGRYIFLKPTTDHAGRFTSVNATVASGNHPYSFTVQEVSADKRAIFDLTVIVEQHDSDALNNIQHPQFVRSDMVEDLKKSLAQKSEELAEVKRNAAMHVVKEQRHEYTWKHGKKADAFGLKAIWNDGKKTYIRAHSQSAPVLYESRDGKDSSIVNYTLEDGLYVTDHVIETGTLQAGKTKLEFHREKESA